MLIAIKPYIAKGTGDEKFKYIFLSELNKPYVGFADERIYVDRIADVDTYDSARAHAYEINRDVFNGKLDYRVVITEKGTDIPF